MYMPSEVQAWIAEGAETDELVEAYRNASADLADLGNFPDAFLTMQAVALILAELATRRVNPTR